MPGPGVFFPRSLTEPEPYCADPARYGHGFGDPRDAEPMRLRAGYAGSEAQILGDWPVGSYSLQELRQAGRELSPEDHLTCPGAQIYIPLGER
ncbi:hypothetical protein AGRA3207_007479 [Actinomadura graeca]|uniref:Uncharacterized protein n=1 Tax=Actinomadura graeca TaxID=2750812 RepID=A0ABX8R4F3_9ACTN|nr:hypothetical protein [Actinomadura graeca]QXJ25910.1 hypothetical protein AGRA3207_007479 [Actinomadura graeca]